MQTKPPFVLRDAQQPTASLPSTSHPPHHAVRSRSMTEGASLHSGVRSPLSAATVAKARSSRH
eukprot:1952916-Lingulodinium_polyedra.AAC.1